MVNALICRGFQRRRYEVRTWTSPGKVPHISTTVIESPSGLQLSRKKPCKLSHVWMTRHRQLELSCCRILGARAVPPSRVPTHDLLSKRAGARGDAARP